MVYTSHFWSYWAWSILRKSAQTWDGTGKSKRGLAMEVEFTGKIIELLGDFPENHV